MIESFPGDLPIGCIACRIKDHSADFGYFLARSAWGKGYAAVAAGLLVDWLKEQADIHRVWAKTDAMNARSSALLERLGLRREGVLRMATYRPNIGGLSRDMVVYGLCREDF